VQVKVARVNLDDRKVDLELIGGISRNDRREQKNPKGAATAKPNKSPVSGVAKKAAAKKPAAAKSPSAKSGDVKVGADGKPKPRTRRRR